MKNFDEALRSFESFLDNVSDDKLDAMLEEIDAMGIQGPSVDDYFSSLNRGVSSFLDEPSEVATIDEVKEFFHDTYIADACVYEVPQMFNDLLYKKDVQYKVQMKNSEHEEYLAGESNYAMAA